MTYSGLDRADSKNNEVAHSVFNFQCLLDGCVVSCIVYAIGLLLLQTTYSEGVRAVNPFFKSYGTTVQQRAISFFNDCKPNFRGFHVFIIYATSCTNSFLT